MKKWIFISLGVLSFMIAKGAQARVETVLGSTPLAQNANLANLMPQSVDSEIILSREQYILSYNRQRRSPNWVAWKLEAKDIGKIPRSKSFLKDPDLERYLAQTGGGAVVDSSEYSGSCFDRGHQVPSRDRTDTDADNQETFLTSNIVPQTSYLNRVIWEHFEQYTRDLVEKQGKMVYVVAGPIYDEDFGAIGPRHDIPVPSKDFKIVFVLDANQAFADIGPNTRAVAVIMPNVLQDGTKPIGSAACGGQPIGSSVDRNDWQKYQSTLAEIQRISGIQFLQR